MCTYYCDHCGYTFSNPRKMGWVEIDGRDECLEENCPKCGNPDFELIEKGSGVEDQTSDPAGRVVTKTKRAIYAIALLAVVWLYYFLV
jgi:hypothetical protein